MSKKAILKVFKYHVGKYAKLQMLDTLLGFLIGFIAVTVVVRLTKADTYSNIGTLIATVMFILSGLILSTVSFTTDFINSVKFNVTRKNYIAGTLLYYTAVSIVGAGFTLLYKLETVMADFIYKGSVSLEPNIGMLYDKALPVFGICLLMVVFGIITGAVSLRFGNKGFLIIYFTFIIGINVLSMYIKQTREVLRSIGIVDLFFNADTSVKIIVAVIVVLAATGASVKVLIKNDIPA